MRTRTTFSIFKALFLVLFLAIGTSVSASSIVPQQDALSATLTQLEGEVQARNSTEGQFAKAKEGQVLPVNGQVQTGNNGRVRLELSNGTVIRVAPSSLFTFKSNEEGSSAGLFSSFMLGIGEIWVILNGGSMDVETPSGVASVRGSEIYVGIIKNANGTYTIIVTCNEGNCSFKTRDGEEYTIPPGQAIVITYDPETGEITVTQRPMTPGEQADWDVILALELGDGGVTSTISKLDPTNSGSYASNAQFSLGPAQVTINDPDAGHVTASLIRMERLTILPRDQFEIVSHSVLVEMTGSGNVQVCFAHPPTKSGLQVVSWNSNASNLISGEWVGMDTFSEGPITCAKVPAGVFALASY